MFGRAVGWLSGVIILGVFASASFAVVSFYSELPSKKPAPKSPVLSLPDGHDAVQRLQTTAYQGPHPSQSMRPRDPFSFPIALGNIGPVEPLFSGPLSYPLLCGKNRITGEQPQVDNQQRWGVPVFDVDQDGNTTEDVVGYSKDCLHKTSAQYFYLNTEDEKFYPLEKLSETDHRIKKITVAGREIEFVVRLENGTINRHFYAIAVLRGESEELASPEGDFWNKRLIYQFRGGVGIGKRQGNLKPGDILKRRKTQLEEGYAVVYSSANQTSNHYNMWLAEDTALRVKAQFIALYGKPLYTVGIGGSGGAIQQYLLAQNNSELLDGLIPLYSYPDMVSQTIYVLDCEPLEYFFDVADQKNSRWDSWHERVQVEGLSSSEEASNVFAVLSKAASFLSGNFSNLTAGVKGASECVQSWRGLTPLINNPHYVHFSNHFSESVSSKVQWTHWDDLSQFYGRDENGYAQSAWDNEGVQYGLEALREKRLPLDEFIRLNRNVGGWVEQGEMKREKFWFLEGEIFPVELSLWSHQNLNHTDSAEFPAPRSRANLDAIAGIYRSGHVFLGYLDKPILDVRHYLDDRLDMHHSSASFMTRARMLKAQGNADNHIVWMSHADFDPINHAFAVMDQWLTRIRINPTAGVVANRPKFAADACFDASGNVIARGTGVWDGEWNNRSQGACMSIFPNHKTSPEIAGGGVGGDVFKCQRQSVTEAISRGIYGDIDVWPHLEQLENTFPSGVCDYRLGDAGRPDDLLSEFTVASVASDKTPSRERVKAEQDSESNSAEDAKPITLSRLDAPAEVELDD
ncbi:MAG: hypothetical protein CL693_09485 [Cellvibrionaceae bacterium]|nr:hypothetical protein [Cellvibrionaceae bacterium]|tara:strand:+ start:8235 stop:10637 length:2403 start_codon:yes stop_codon:yes gene_type:complete